MSLKILGCIPCVLHLGPQPRIWARGRCTGHVPHVSQDHCHTGNLTSQLLAVVLRCCCWSVGVALLFFFCVFLLVAVVLNDFEWLFFIVGGDRPQASNCLRCCLAWQYSFHVMPPTEIQDLRARTREVFSLVDDAIARYKDWDLKVGATLLYLLYVGIF